MANQEIDILVKLKDEASAGIKKLQANTSSFKDSLNKVGVASSVALVGISAFAKGAVDAAMDQERANTQLEAVLKSTKGAVGLTSEAIQDLASKLQYTTGVEDDVIQSAQNMLLTFTNIGKDVFPNATQMTLDMATAMNGGLKPSAEQLSNQAIQLGKALNDPIQGMGALKKVGVAFTESQKEQITTLQKSGDIMGAQKIILNELATEFGGSAVAQTKTFEGQMGLLNIQLKDTYESIGTSLIPVIKDLIDTVAPYLKKLSDWIKKNPELTKDIILVAGACTSLGAAAIILGPIITGLTVIFTALGVVLTFLSANPIVLIIAGLVALGVAIYEIYKNWDTIKPLILEIVKAISDYITEKFEWVMKKVGDTIDWIKNKAQLAKEYVQSIFSETAKIGGNMLIQGALGLNADFSKKLDGARANGGPVRGGGSYLVGENGPEIFTPRSSGNITPNGGGMGTININFGNVSVRGQNDIDSLANKVGDVLMRQLQLQKQGIS